VFIIDIKVLCTFSTYSVHTLYK